MHVVVLLQCQQHGENNQFNKMNKVMTSNCLQSVSTFSLQKVPITMQTP